jgi:pyridoxal phosphate enzyme (YggS family)
MDYREIVGRNLPQVEERIAEAALRAGRDPHQITVVAITKSFPMEAALAAYEMGLHHLGENRPEEGETKVTEVNEALEGPRPTWHMVGHIQSRKAALAAAHFDVIHSVDRLKIARRLSRFATAAGRELPILLECNVSGEESKYGFSMDRWSDHEGQREAFFSAVAAILSLDRLRMRGLMTMAPLVDDPEETRPVFAGLRALRDTLKARFPQADWRDLSMGMTDDFEVAVEEGATLLRLGRAIFGPRPGE